MPKTKQCTGCLSDLPLHEFSSSGQYLRSRCRPCEAKQQRKRRKRASDAESSDTETVETNETLSVKYYGERWKDKDEILEDMGVDLAIWEVVEVTTKGWEVTGKRRSEGQDELWKSKNRYISIKLRRRAPRQIQEGIRELLKRMKWPTSPAAPDRKKKTHVMEVSLYDIHLGKVCWGPITGEHYDNKIAQRIFLGATDDLLHKTDHVDVGRIILPIGNDFFHVDNWLGTTASGTHVEGTDDRFSKTFTAGVDSMRVVINRCLEVSPVELIYVPGNHDQATSFYLASVLRYAYESNKHVSCDVENHTGHGCRKYLRFGRTLLAYAHGKNRGGGKRDTPPDDKLPLLMATERAEDWAQTIDRAWRLGHEHTKRTKIVPIMDIFNGVRVERLPSLSGTDQWHYDNGFTGNRRAAEAWLWSMENGYEGQFTAYARE